jgi:hypothetical protein
VEIVENEERLGIVGTSKEWKEYKSALHSMLEEDARQRSVPGRGDLSHFFKHLDAEGTPTADADGVLWMHIPAEGESVSVGLSASNVLASGSDASLAYELILARARDVLKSPKHRRETLAEFRQDWAALQAARQKSVILTANLPPAGSRGRQALFDYGKVATAVPAKHPALD